ncbi:hypothetical protein BKP45_05010 [Anaerobacillus alkalidiazotrophicus]|uniref:Uncharacterized protein n=1 Tax=Anaerobacillus alkalidiazotrophicus TaxID=472963 RepID=A0A1S2MBI8_9BACI|nr:hypothetical protein [Anaerobacillus alkalidiazotrophicus]OIJ22039.1 hypothetical protein BKP45_05010 [Anaerobacillus alkalidiazotrophicus]
MKQGKLNVFISGEQLKTILFSLHHMLAPNEYLDEEDRELLEMLEEMHDKLFSVENESSFDNEIYAIDDLPY